MLKTFKRLSFLLALTLIVNIALPLIPTASAAGPSTNLTIHKITGSEARTATYGELEGTEIPSGDPISNITFTYWSVSKEQLDTLKANPSEYTSVEQVTNYLGRTGVETPATGADGTTNVSGLEEGYYWFVENGSTAVSEAYAVPFGLELPITNEAGTGYITDLHVYPKNVLEGYPTIDKDVKTEGNKSSSFNIGDSFEWIIKPSIVKGIEEYESFIVRDNLDSQLTYENTRVTLDGTQLTEGVDYTIATNGQEISVIFTADGLDKLGAAGQTGELRIYVSTYINETAVIGRPILNNATIEFNNGHGTVVTPGNPDEPTVPPTDQPKVYTGGKKFVKVNEDSQALQGAEFIIQNEAGSFLQENNTWGERATARVFVSDSNGAFEVVGLAYGADGSNNNGSTDYTLVEIKAPSGYAIPTDPTTVFTVNSTSYYADPTSSELVAATPDNILNKKQSLPMTGGMGTIIFTVVGLALMLIAFMMIKKRREA